MKFRVIAAVGDGSGQRCARNPVRVIPVADGEKRSAQCKRAAQGDDAVN